MMEPAARFGRSHTVPSPDVGTAMTRKDTNVNWDQIESKWALMTRRIRADWGDDLNETTEVSLQTLKRRDAVAPGIADTRAFVGKETEFKTSAN